MIQAHRVWALWLLGALLSFSIGLYYYTPGGHNGTLLGADFINVWAGTQLGLADSTTLFDLKRYNDGLLALMGGNFPRHNWSYPPFCLWLFEPFTWLPYVWGLVAWSVLGLVAYGCAVWPWLRTSGGRPALRDVAFFLVSPAVIITLFTGQNGLFTSALTLWALRMVACAPMQAGAAVGLLALKPQLGLVWPLVLLRLRAWRSFAIASAVVVSLVGGSWLVMGHSIWQHYLSFTAPFQLSLISGPFTGKLYQFMMPTLPISASMLGVPFSISIVVHGIIACGVMLALWRMLPRASVPTQALVITTSVLLITPYAFNYDMGALSAVLALHLRQHPARLVGEKALMLAVYFMPAWVILCQHLRWPLAYPLLLLLFIYAVLRARREH